MDVGNYISELLAQKGEVSVPGLGYFAHTRVNGYYNEREGKIYPPTYSVQFDPQLIDDDTLAQYMADKKKISVASAKYFTEKYINGLKQQAQTDEAALADLGWFYMEQGRLFFSPNNEQVDDPNFFGYEPVALNRLDGTPKVERSFASTEAPAPTPAPTQTPYTEPETFAVAPEGYPDREEGMRYETDEEYAADLEEEARRRKRRGNWILAICILGFFALAVFLVYRYDPNIFNFASVKTAVKAKPADTVINARVETIPANDTAAAPKDTMKAAAQPDMQTGLPKKADSASVKNVPAVNDTMTGTRYEILGGSFATTKKAEQAVANYKRKGLAATIVNLPGSRMHRISLGTFKTREEATVAQQKLIKDKKIKEKDVYVQFVK